MITEKSEAVLAYLKLHYADAKCALVFHNPFECLVAISLSAQTTDKSVNQVTPKLFEDFPTPEKMAKAPIEAIEKDIQSLGLYHNKARNLSQLSQDLQGKFHGEVPLDFDLLTTLSGVGTKTAGVFLLEMASRPAIPVDTHVHRIAERLGYAKKDDEPLKVEAKLEKSFLKEEWMFLHHALINFGRQECHAQNPMCEQCGLKEYCSYFKKCSSIKGK
jgi:endonuclease III